MFRFTPYVIKSLLRHRGRTLLTVSGAAVALLVFCFVASVQEGLHRLTDSEHAQRTLIVFQESRFCPTSSRLPQDYADRIGKLPGVRNVVPVLVWTNSCRSILDAIVFHGVPAAELRSARDLSLSSGDWSEFSGRHDAALVGRNVARRRNLAVGEQFSIGEISVKVAGVFESPMPAEEDLIYTNLQFLQYTPGLNAAGLVTQHEVHLTDDVEPEAVARAIDQALRAGPVATTTRRKGAFQASALSDLVDLIGFAHWLGYACVALVLSLVAATTVMSVQDRIREHAVLQTLGLRPARVFRLVIAESLLMCVVGGVLGTATALAVLASGGMAVGAEGVTISFRPSWQLAAMGITVSLAVGILAALMPAFQAARTQIVSALRKA
jgi:putative ABC transport system permease protein